MKRKLLFIFFVLLVLSVSLSAQDAETKNVADATPLFLYSIICGTVCLTVAAVGGAFAQSKALRTAVENIGRNPAAVDSIRGVLIIGLALIESLVIYVLLVDLILYFVKWGNYTF
ncbi:MAG: ATP synthase F0 subunit C [Candidatus Aminicenantes bacterium]|nr:ATP synthase F0 subunit C [Candidatus Aminicenantes bacterium]